MDSYRPLPGTPVKDLDTPCLLIELDALDHNFAVTAETYRDSECKMREHTKNIKSPLLALRREGRWAAYVARSWPRPR